jgi:hypothetical protein
MAKALPLEEVMPGIGQEVEGDPNIVAGELPDIRSTISIGNIAMTDCPSVCSIA